MHVVRREDILAADFWLWILSSRAEGEMGEGKKKRMGEGKHETGLEWNESIKRETQNGKRARKEGKCGLGNYKMLNKNCLFP